MKMEEHNHQNQETAPIIPAPEGIYNVSNETAMNIERAELVLSYIINQGIDISEDLVKTVVDSKFMSRQKKWNPEIEVKFRMAYKELTKIIKPVTVDSLISSRPKPLSGNGAFEKMLSFVGKKERNAFSHISARGYTIGTIITMVCLLFIQIYFYIGSTRLANITECEKEIETKESRLNELLLVKEVNDDNMAVNNEYERVFSNILELDEKRKSNIEMLRPWTKRVRAVTFTGQMKTDSISLSSKDFDKANTAIVQEAKSYVWIIGIYILPLLYGVIGGFTFVLREINEEIKNMTFSDGSNVKYLLRILLGAIAGLSVGLFWGDIEHAQKLGLSSLSPMLLAFIGGYCVEYLLQFIEKVANMFFKKYDPENQKKEKADSDKTQQ
ncbi:MAG: hypothetical protein IIU03_00330 [Bacteroidales bacterium]|nr:hypothetical protein [Bacteroidales bacterium]MBR4678701.1 hypothetical protein [Bacteroidales bacterium]